MTDETSVYRLIYRGPADLVGYVQQQLAEEGIEVTYSPPMIERSIGGDVHTLLLVVVGHGLTEASMAVVRGVVASVRERFPSIEVEPDDPRRDRGYR